jgi:hypothetical protein
MTGPQPDIQAPRAGHPGPRPRLATPSPCRDGADSLMSRLHSRLLVDACSGTTRRWNSASRRIAAPFLGNGERAAPSEHSGHLLQRPRCHLPCTFVDPVGIVDAASVRLPASLSTGRPTSSAVTDRRCGLLRASGR